MNRLELQEWLVQVASDMFTTAQKDERMPARGACAIVLASEDGDGGVVLACVSNAPTREGLIRFLRDYLAQLEGETDTPQN